MRFGNIMIAGVVSVSLAPLALAQQARESMPPQHPQVENQKSDPEQQFKAGQGHEEPGAATKAEKEGAHSPPQTAGSLDKGTIKQVQEKLNERGYDAGAADGMIGPKTQAAIKEFQQSEGIEATGELNQETLAGLDIEGETAGRGEGVPMGSSSETGAIEPSDSAGYPSRGEGVQEGRGSETGAINPPGEGETQQPAGNVPMRPGEIQQQ